MTAKLTTFITALKDELETELEKTVNFRFLPYFSDPPSQLASERITIFPLVPRQEVGTRGGDFSFKEIGIEVAQSLPESGDQTEENPGADYNNLEFMDARLETMETIMELFNDELGGLREKNIGDYLYQPPIRLVSEFDRNALLQRLFSTSIAVPFHYVGEE